MNDSIKNSLSDQANHELYAAHCYRAMAFWCDDRDYNGFAKFFYEQADEEQAHALRFFTHLLDRGIQPRVTGIKDPKNEFDNILEVALQARALEKANTEYISACYELAVAEKDYLSQPMLLEFIQEQVEELSWTDTMLTLTERAQCSGATYNLDRHIRKDLRGESEG
ncbi:MAG: ferritin [Opitutales bacterium]